MFDRVAAAVVRRLEAAIALMLALMVVLVFGNVVLRYGFNSGIAVSEEASRYLFIWLTFIGAVIAMHEHAHLGIDSLLRALPRRGKIACVLASDVLMLATVGLLFHGSWKQTVITFSTRSPVSEVPLALIYVAGLAASAMMGALLLRDLYRVTFVGAADRDLMLSVESEGLAGIDQATQALLAGRDGSAAAPDGGARRGKRM